MFLIRKFYILNLHLSTAFVKIGSAVHGLNSDALIMYLKKYNYATGVKSTKTRPSAALCYLECDKDRV